MDMFWQQVIIYAALAIAVGYLVFHYIRRRKKRCACGGCKAGELARQKMDEEQKLRQPSN
ncbi:FeoB-associated Cys-rich membrane protein [candidate division GN15 bacterium]|nr:FeoB-associated Cys-rich membrane protein [candidate division GN15 bacterium]